MKYIALLFLVVSIGCSQSTKQADNGASSQSFDPTIIGDEDFSDIMDEADLESDFSGEANIADDFSDDFSEDFSDSDADVNFDDFADSEPGTELDSFEDSFDQPMNNVITETAPVFEPPPQVAQPVYEPPQVISGRQASKIQNIEYFSDKMGGTVVVSTDGDVNYSSRFDPSTRQLIIEVDNALLPNQLKRPYIMKDFAGASFSALNAYQGNGSSMARVVVQVKSDSEPSVYKEGNSIIIKQGSYGMADNATSFDSQMVADSAPIMETSSTAKNQALGARTMEEFLMTNQNFYGHPISVEFREAEIKEVIDFLAEESGTNIVLSGDVKGTISVKLKQVPWDQALVIVMRSQELGYIRQGNVIRIAKTSNLQAEQDKALAIIERKLQSAPLQVQMIPVNYSDVAGLSGQISPFLTEGRGKIVSDARTSALIVTDTQENIQKILDGDYALPNNLRTSIINLKKNEGRFYWSNEEYLKSQQTYLDLFKNKFTSSDRITQVKAIPDLLLSDQLTFTNIREAAVRTQSDIVIVYSIDSDLYSKYKLFTKNDIKAYATTQLIILDIRTGLIPFSTIVTKEFLSQKQEEDFNETEATNRVKNQAVLLTIEEIGQQIADFLKDEIN